MAKFSRLFIFIVFAVSCQLSAVSCQVFAQDKIIAIINEDCITQKDLNDFLNFMRIQLSPGYRGRALETKLQSLKVDLLDKLIEDRLILQEAKKEKIAIDENRIKARLNEIKKGYASEPEFQNELIRQGLSQADIETKVREQLLMYAVIQAKIRQKISVGPNEVTSFYEKNPDEFIVGEEREVETITLEDEGSAKTFVYSLKTGEKIEELATRYTFNLSQIKARKNDELRPDIEEIIFKLMPQEISGPVKIDEKYYIFRLKNIIAGKKQPLAEVQDRIYNFLYETKMQEALAQWLDGLKKESYIKIISD